MSDRSGVTGPRRDNRGCFEALLLPTGDWAVHGTSLGGLAKAPRRRCGAVVTSGGKRVCSTVSSMRPSWATTVSSGSTCPKSRSTDHSTNTLRWSRHRPEPH